MLKTPEELLQSVATNSKARRLAENWTQEALAKRAGVTLACVRRFEQSGQIGLESLAKLAIALRCEESLERLFPPVDITPKNLDELLKEPKPRKRGRLKP